MTWPDWWTWQLELTVHVKRRMLDRDFTEVDLRRMLRQAEGWRRSRVSGRVVVHAQLRDQDWEVILEPDPTENVLVVVTAYPVNQG